MPRDADFYLCGPSAFMNDLAVELGTGVSRPTASAVRFSAQLRRGHRASRRHLAGPPHQPAGSAGVGPLVSFARSGLNVRWAPAFQSLLELAEACDVPVRWACRTGVCHTCETGLINGAVGYQPEPVEPPAEGNALICCSRPQGDIVIDL